MAAKKSPWDRLYSQSIGPAKGVLVGKVVWPDLVEVEGFVLLSEHYDPAYFERIRREMGAENVEQTINLAYLPNLVGPVDAPDAEWEMLGSLLCETWIWRARSMFPGREFSTTFQWYSDMDPGVTLFQTSIRHRRP